MNHFKTSIINLGGLIILNLVLLQTATPVKADSFIVQNGETVFNVPTLNNGETGIVETGATVTNPNSSQSIVNIQGDSAVFENRGTVSMQANSSRVVSLSGSNSQIINEGSITTFGNNSFGIFAFAANLNANIINNGTINTKESSSAAILSFNLASAITNNGTLLMEGASSTGISLENRFSTTTNNGTIKILRENGFGIFSDVNSFNNKIINNGIISTSGDSSLGIMSRGMVPTITNNGTITTNGNNAHGIRFNPFFFAPQGTIINNGTVTTLGDNSGGLVSSGTATNTINNGNLQTQGMSSPGISVAGNGNTIINRGTITTTGTGAHGIVSGGNQTTISNTSSNSIKTTGAGSIGINNVFGNNVVINNSGRIAATGNSTVAIQGGGNNETLNLLAGSQIQGIINLGAGTNTINIFGTGSDRPFSSSTLSINGTANVNTFGENIVNSGGVIQVVDVTGLSSNASALGMKTTGIHGSLINHLAHSSSPRPVQLAASRVESGMMPDSHNQRAWLGGFGAYRERGDDARQLDYDQAVYGFSGGYDISFHRIKAGLMAGYGHSDLSTEIKSIDNATDSYFLGGYGQTRLGGITFTTALLGGYQDHDNNRQVMDNIAGLEVAQADFDGYFFSPAITLGTSFELGRGVELRPSGSLIYSLAFHDDYTETGTTRSNISVPDRTVQALIGRMQLAAGYEISRGREFEFRIGGMSRYTDEDTATASFAGTPFRYSTVTDDTVFGGYVGGNYRMTLMDCLHLIGDFEYGVLEGSEDYSLGQLELQFRF